MPITILDLVVLGVIAISALLASVRGFTREVLAIASWGVAAAVAWLFHPQLLPVVQQYIPNKTVALVAAIAALFLVTLIVVSIITSRISDFVLDSRIGALDRTLGFLFGAGRGLLLCIVGFLLFTQLVPPKMQENYTWLRDARSRPLLEQGGQWLQAALPADLDLDFVKKLKPKNGGADQSEPPPEEQKTPDKSTQAPEPTELPKTQRVIAQALKR